MEGIIKNLHWSSDWDGHEVGFPEVNVVGCYDSAELNVSMYINTETGEVLEIWTIEE
jgi:hypothetical protein